MKFLVDRCAGRRLTDWLIQQGHDAVYSADIGPDPGDAELLALAEREKRILITIDTDFGQLAILEQAPHAGILRLPDVPASARTAIVGTILAHHTDPLEAGAVITVRGNRIRVSLRPASQE